MKKRTKLLAILSALILLIGAVTAFSFATVATDATPYLSIDKHALSMRDSVVLRYALTVNNADASDVKVLVWHEPQSSYTVNDAPDATLTSPSWDSQGYYLFDYAGIKMPQMGMSLYAVAYYQTADGTEYYSELDKYSVLEYAYTMLGKINPEVQGDEKLKNLLNAMLDFGAMAQISFPEVSVGAPVNGEFSYIALDGGVFTSDNTAKGLFPVGSEIEISAPKTDAAGNVFYRWVDGYGNTVSEEATTTIYLYYNTAYTAEYVNSATCPHDNVTHSDIPVIETEAGCVVYKNVGICDLCHAEVDEAKGFDFTCDVYLETYNGNWISSRCEKCGLLYVGDYIKTASVGNCTTANSRDIIIYNKDIPIYTHTEYWLKSEHDYTYTLLSGNCEDGYEALVKCAVCKHEFVTSGTGHFVNMIEINTAEFGACGGFMDVDVCELCDYVSLIGWRDDNCRVYPTESVDGYEIYACDTCGAEQWYKYVKGDVDDKCRYLREDTFKYICNGETKYEYTSSSYEYDHDYEYTITSGSCVGDGGYDAIKTCKKCGDTDTVGGWGHDLYSIYLFDASDFGGCKGGLSGNKCNICGEIQNVYIDTECVYEFIVTETDTDIYEVLTCSVCDAEIRIRSTKEQQEDCSVKNIQHYVCLYDGDIKYEDTYNSYHMEHNYTIYEIISGNCVDGYEIKRICEDCGAHDMLYGSGHIYEASEILKDLSGYGCCDGSISKEICVLCGEYGYISIDTECDFSETPVRYNGYNAYVCTVCGAAECVKQTVTVGDCAAEFDYEFAFVYDDEYLYKWNETEWETMHTYEYTVLSGDCERYEVRGVCSVCGDVCEIEDTYHLYEEKFIFTEEFGSCGCVICVEYCAICEKTLDVYIAHQMMCFLEYIETDADGYEVYGCFECKSKFRAKETDEVEEGNTATHYCFEYLYDGEVKYSINYTLVNN